MLLDVGLDELDKPISFLEDGFIYLGGALDVVVGRGVELGYVVLGNVHIATVRSAAWRATWLQLLITRL